MSKLLSFNAKAAIAFILFCALFVSVVCIMVDHANRSEQRIAEGSTEAHTSPYESLPVVIIDAGHGGEDGGAVGVNGCAEKDINLAIALELEQMLRAVGIKTRLTRSTDILLYDKDSDYKGHKKEQDLDTRLAIAEEYESAIFISIHMNSFPQQKYSGLQVYYSPNSPTSAVIARKIQDLAVTSIQPNNKRKIKQSDENIYLLSKINHPAILIECGFLSNPEECAALCSAEYRSRLCAVFYAAIADFYNGMINGAQNS